MADFRLWPVGRLPSVLTVIEMATCMSDCWADAAADDYRCPFRFIFVPNFFKQIYCLTVSLCQVVGVAPQSALPRQVGLSRISPAPNFCAIPANIWKYLRRTSSPFFVLKRSNAAKCGSWSPSWKIKVVSIPPSVRKMGTTKLWKTVATSCHCGFIQSVLHDKTCTNLWLGQTVIVIYDRENIQYKNTASKKRIFWFWIVWQSSKHQAKEKTEYQWVWKFGSFYSVSELWFITLNRIFTRWLSTEFLAVKLKKNILQVARIYTLSS